MNDQEIYIVETPLMSLSVAKPCSIKVESGYDIDIGPNNVTFFVKPHPTN